MGEIGPESEDPFALNFEAHLLGRAGIAGFSDERQDVTRDQFCNRSVVGEGEMSS